MLRDEFKKSMQLIGANSIKKLDKEYIVKDYLKELYKMLLKQSKL